MNGSQHQSMGAQFSVNRARMADLITGKMPVTYEWKVRNKSGIVVREGCDTNTIMTAGAGYVMDLVFGTGLASVPNFFEIALIAGPTPTIVAGDTMGSNGWTEINDDKYTAGAGGVRLTWLRSTSRSGLVWGSTGPQSFPFIGTQDVGGMALIFNDAAADVTDTGGTLYGAVASAVGTLNNGDTLDVTPTVTHTAS